MQYTCSVCQEKVEGDLIKFSDHTDAHIIEVIKQKHPEWTDDNGLCERCVNYYRQQIKGEA